MKKILSIAVFCIALIGCSTKKNVENEVTKPTENNNRVITFVKKLDSVPKSINRSVAEPTAEGAVKNFYDNYYTPLMNSFNSEVGRDIPNDGYIKMDSEGNFLEFGGKFESDKLISKLVSEPTLLPFLDKESNKKFGAGVYDKDNVLTHFYESPTKKIVFAIENGVYKKMIWSDYGKLVLNEDGVPSYAGLGYYTGTLLWVDGFLFPIEGFINLIGEPLNLYDNNKKPLYENLKIVFNYSKNRVELYNDNNYLGYANANISYNNSVFKIQQSNDTSLRVEYNEKKQVKKITNLYYNTKEEKEIIYDETYGVIKETCRKINDVLIEKSTNLYSIEDKKFNWMKYSYIKYEEDGVTVISEEVDEIKVLRNSNGEIKEIETNLNFGPNKILKGIFVPK